jgi:hypothetical protein
MIHNQKMKIMTINITMDQLAFLDDIDIQLEEGCTCRSEFIRHILAEYIHWKSNKIPFIPVPHPDPLPVLPPKVQLNQVRVGDTIYRLVSK